MSKYAESEKFQGFNEKQQNAEFVATYLHNNIKGKR